MITFVLLTVAQCHVISRMQEVSNNYKNSPQLICILILDAKETERKISKTGKEIMKNAIDIDSPDGDKKPEVSQPNKKTRFKEVTIIWSTI